MTSLQSRLNRIAQHMPRERCPWCADHPTRVMHIDGATDVLLSETMPESGCAACGRMPYRTMVIVAESRGVDVAAAT